MTVPAPEPPDFPARRREPAPRPQAGSAELVVASFNLHAGIDGWGRPFDVLEACRAIDADVLVLQECWTPAEGARGGSGDTRTGPAAAPAIAAALGYTVVEQPLATGRLAGPHPEADHRWMRHFDWRSSSCAIYLDGHRPLPASVTRTARFESAEPGSWGVAVLSRLPVTGHRVVELGRLRRDRAARAALVVDVLLDGRTFTVVGTHMAHLTYGSLRHFRRLRRVLDETVGPGPAALAADTNLWGPAVERLFPGWRRAVRGRTWPAWRPHSQVDHILVRGPVGVVGGDVLPLAGSDHRPVRTRLVVGGRPAPLQ